jgi:hypothetical protein
MGSVLMLMPQRRTMYLACFSDRYDKAKGPKVVNRLGEYPMAIDSSRLLKDGVPPGVHRTFTNYHHSSPDAAAPGRFEAVNRETLLAVRACLYPHANIGR